MPPGPKAQDLYSSPRSVTYASTFVDDDGIKLSVATNVAAQSYSGATLDGALANPGPAVNRLPQVVTVVTGASAATYNVASPIVVTGTNYAGDVITDSLQPTNANGGETVVGVKAFKTVTGIATPAQSGGGGTFKFGVQDVLLDPPARELRHGADGTINLKDADGNADPLPGFAGEHQPVCVSRIVGSGTTFPLTVYV